MKHRKALTIQLFWQGQWHDAGCVVFPDPVKGLTGSMSFFYDSHYVCEVTSQDEGLTFVDERSIGCNVPGDLMRQYDRGPMAPILRDIIPQGAGRRHLLKGWCISSDPGPAADFRLLSEGCVAPIGNLRIKEATEAFERRAQALAVPSFTLAHVCNADTSLIEHADSLGLFLDVAAGAGGDAPKLLVVEDANGRFYPEGLLSEHEAVGHWLVKFPRGRMSAEDGDILRAEAVFYQALYGLGKDTIASARLYEGKVPSLWMPRFDRSLGSKGLKRLAVESLYSLNQQVGDGGRMSQVTAIRNLRRIMGDVADFDAALCEYLVRDVVNYSIGNTDNHGRNTSVIKQSGRITLAPAYDLAPMVLDGEGIARSTVWPRGYMRGIDTPDYRTIIQDFAGDPQQVMGAFREGLEALAGLKDRVRELGMPKRVMDNPRVVLDKPKQVLLRL
jgi:serine/threonine-protein kinase HipA